MRDDVPVSRNIDVGLINLPGMFKRLLKKLIRIAGYQIAPLVRAGEFPELTHAMRRLRRRKTSFNTVIDVGASDGRWSALCMKEFPTIDYYLIEAQPVHKLGLQRFCTAHPNCRYTLSAAGAEAGSIYFDASNPFGGVASVNPFDHGGIKVPVTTIDLEVQKERLRGPFLIKLDTHGFEVPILHGAQSTLSQTEVLILECYNFRVQSESLLFCEMCSFVARFGFRCIDLFDILYRPYDNTFWQMDIMFMRAERPEFDYRRFR